MPPVVPGWLSALLLTPSSFFFIMSLISKFRAVDGQPVPVRLTKPVQQLTIRRSLSIAHALSVTSNGLSLALPETVTMEITHPSRKRVDGGTVVPLAMVALWSQYLRGPIAESQTGAGDAAVVTSEVHYFLNQSSPIELSSEDQFFVTLAGLVGGADYEVYAPEQPILVPNHTKFYNYELVRILASDREKTLMTANHVGLMIPNAPEKISEVRITYLLQGGGQKEEVYTLRELLSQAQQANPFVSVLNTPGGTRFSLSQDANYILLSLNFVPQVEIHTVLGQEVDYMLVKVLDRNDLG